MMFVSLGLGTFVALALIVTVSLLTGGATSTLFQKQTLDGQKIPSFSLAGLHGGTTAMPWAHGSPTVVVFFASWCVPCIEELPRVATYVKQHSLGTVRVIGIDYNDSRSRGRAFARRAGVTFPVVADPNEQTQGLFLLGGIPDTIFLNGNGVVSHTVYGVVSNELLAVGISALH